MMSSASGQPQIGGIIWYHLKFETRETAGGSNLTQQLELLIPIPTTEQWQAVRGRPGYRGSGQVSFM